MRIGAAVFRHERQDALVLHQDRIGRGQIIGANDSACVPGAIVNFGATQTLF